MKTSHLTLTAIACLGLSPLAVQPQEQAPPCAESDGYVCGQQGPEDLVGLGSDWAVASAYSGTGGVGLIRLSDRMSYTAYPSDLVSERLDSATYPDCPGPPGRPFTSHGRPHALRRGLG